MATRGLLPLRDGATRRSVETATNLSDDDQVERFALLMVVAACHSSSGASPDARHAADASLSVTCNSSGPVLVASGYGSSAACMETLGLDISCGAHGAPGSCLVTLGDSSGAMQTLQQTVDCDDNVLVFSVPAVCNDAFLVLSVAGSDFTATCGD